MNYNLYSTPDNIIAGITMKDPAEPESGNMALHACENTESILENRRKLATFLSCGLDDFVSAYQCHSSNFRRVSQADKGRGSVTMGDAILNTDALYTFEPNLLLCCFTADCVPLILYGEADGLIGVIHSGWEGTSKEITPKVLEYIIRDENIDPQNLKIIIGPAISQAKFEVDRDVYDRFKALGYADEFMYYNERTGKYHIDNQLVVKRQCELLGIPTSNITMNRVCTHTSPDCFSHRRDKSCGRHLSFIIRKE
jgi:YfiH family protein